MNVAWPLMYSTLSCVHGGRERGEEGGRDHYESFPDGKEMVTQQLNLFQVIPCSRLAISN